MAAGREEPLVAPENFAMVFPGVYRSGFPKKRHFPFLKKIGVKTILTLVLEEYPTTNVDFNHENGVTLMQFAVPGNKEPFVDIPEDKIRAAVEQLLDVRKPDCSVAAATRTTLTAERHSLQPMSSRVPRARLCGVASPLQHKRGIWVMAAG